MWMKNLCTDLSLFVYFVSQQGSRYLCYLQYLISTAFVGALSQGFVLSVHTCGDLLVRATHDPLSHKCQRVAFSSCHDFFCLPKINTPFSQQLLQD